MKVKIQNRNVIVDENNVEVSHEQTLLYKLFISVINSSGVLGRSVDVSDEQCLRLIEFIKEREWEREPWKLNIDALHWGAF